MPSVEKSVFEDGVQVCLRRQLAQYAIDHPEPDSPEMSSPADRQYRFNIQASYGVGLKISHGREAYDAMFAEAAGRLHDVISQIEQIGETDNGKED